MKTIIIKLIRKYQSIPFKCHDSCRLIPTCSNYMIEAIEEYDVIKGVYLGIKRIFKCAWSDGYKYDPVPKKSKRKS